MSGDGFIASRPPDRVEAPVPRLGHAEAEAVGSALHDYLEKLGLCVVNLNRGQVLDPEAILPRGELAWADAVQFILRRASENQQEREDG